MNPLIQLPDDAKLVGYVRTGPYSFESVYTSQAAGMTGTEQEFLAAGHAYAYVQVDQHTRRLVTDILAVQAEDMAKHPAVLAEVTP